MIKTKINSKLKFSRESLTKLMFCNQMLTFPLKALMWEKQHA